jgi:hypothetical protein
VSRVKSGRVGARSRLPAEGGEDEYGGRVVLVVVLDSIGIPGSLSSPEVSRTGNVGCRLT